MTNMLLELCPIFSTLHRRHSYESNSSPNAYCHVVCFDFETKNI